MRKKFPFKYIEILDKLSISENTESAVLNLIEEYYSNNSFED
jgi:hypothetical protein